MIRAHRIAATARDDASLISGWNIAPNIAYSLYLAPSASACGVFLFDEGMTTLIASGAAITGVAQPCVLVPNMGTAEMVDVDLGWHLLITTDGTEGDRTIRINPSVDLPDEIHPIYGDDGLALVRATAGINASAHYIDDLTVTCPLGLGAGLGDVASVPVDGAAVVGQVGSITWAGTPNGASEQAMIRRHVAIAPEPYVEPVPITPPTVADDTGTTDAATVTSGNVLTNDEPGLTIVAVNGLSANVGQPVAGSNGGLFVIAGDGTWTFDPDGDFAVLAGSETAATSVTYHASDGAAEASAILTVTVSSGAVPVWHPSSLFGPSDIGGAWDLTDHSTLYQDAAGTTQVTAAGQSIMRASDISGKGTHLTQPNATYAMIARADSGLNYAEGAASPLRHLLLNLAANIAYPFAMMICGDSTEGASGSNSAGFSVSQATANDQSCFCIGKTGAENKGPAAAVYRTSWSQSLTNKDPRKFVAISTFKSGSQLVQDDQGAASTPINITCPSSMEALTLGGLRRSSGLTTYPGRYFCALYINRELTSDEKTNLFNWAKAKAGIV
jgi:VCBS repeat-containing protein